MHITRINQEIINFIFQYDIPLDMSFNEIFHYMFKVHIGLPKH